MCLKKIPIVFCNGSNYDYHFIIKGLAEKFNKQFPCLGVNNEKYITFTVPMEKEVTRINKNGKVTSNDNNKFILLLQKGVYPYEYMDNW